MTRFSGFASDGVWEHIIQRSLWVKQAPHILFMQCSLVIMFSYLVVYTSTYACKFFIFFYFYNVKVATQSYTPSTTRLLTP